MTTGVCFRRRRQFYVDTGARALRERPAAIHAAAELSAHEAGDHSPPGPGAEPALGRKGLLPRNGLRSKASHSTLSNITRDRSGYQQRASRQASLTPPCSFASLFETKRLKGEVWARQDPPTDESGRCMAA